MYKMEQDKSGKDKKNEGCCWEWKQSNFAW